MVSPENTGYFEQRLDLQHRRENSGNKIFENVSTVVENLLNLIGSVLIVTYLFAGPHCMLREEIGRSHLTSGLLAGAGVSCILLGIFSSKLIITGGNRMGYLVCTLLFWNQQKYACPGSGDIYAMGSHERTETWQTRLQIIQGPTIFVCILQIVIGLVGFQFLLRSIRPVSIVSTMVLLGAFVVKTSAVTMADNCWNLFIFSTSLMFLLYIVYYYSMNTKKGFCSDNVHVPLRSKLFVGLISVFTVWLSCAVLSSFELVWPRSPARTDVYTGALDNAPTFRISYFFQWGAPKWQTEAVFIMLPAAFISIFEVFGHYYAVINAESLERTIPNDSRSFGKNSWSAFVTLEAVFCLLASTMGTSLGITVDRRETNQKFQGIFVGIALILLALSGTACALLVTIPETIVAALIFSVFLSVILEGLNLMRFVDMKSNRNLYVLGLSLFIGLVVPVFIQNDAQKELTSYRLLNDILICILSTEFIVGSLAAIILDNLIEVFSRKKYAQHMNEKPDTPHEYDKNIGEGPSIGVCDCLSPFCI